MKNIIPVFMAIMLLSLGACSSATNANLLPNLSAAETGQNAVMPEISSTQQGLIPATGIVEAANLPTSTPKPKNKNSAGGTKVPKENKPANLPNNPGGKNPMVVPTSASPDFIAAEITGRPTDKSVTLNVVPATQMQITYEYGTASGAYQASTTVQTAMAKVPLETLISGLKANTRYYYRIRYGGSAGLEHTFMTQRSPGSTFTFAIQGDSHPERLVKQFDPDLYTRTLKSAASSNPDFYMTIGDDFSVDALKTVNAEVVQSLYINQRQWLGLVGAPIFLVNGNHEQAAMANLNGTANNVAVWAQNARNAYFPQPAPDTFYTGDATPVEFIGQLRDYFAYTWGDALFVVIDPYWHSSMTVDNQFGGDKTEKGKRDLWNTTLGDEQYQWFKQTLETSKSKYKFVFTHHVNGKGRGGVEVAKTYEWGDSANLSKHRPGWGKTIQQLMADNHVTIFFQGHDHLFAKQELDGVIYQTMPSPADPNYAPANADAFKSGDKLPASGHVRVSVSPNQVKVDYVRSYLEKPDEIAYSYTVQ